MSEVCDHCGLGLGSHHVPDSRCPGRDTRFFIAAYHAPQHFPLGLRFTPEEQRELKSRLERRAYDEAEDGQPASQDGDGWPREC